MWRQIVPEWIGRGGGGTVVSNQPTSVLQHARQEALNPLCLDFGKSSDPVTPDIPKSKESMVCKDLRQCVCKIVWNFYAESNYQFPCQNTAIYGAALCCSLFINDHHPRGVSKLRGRKLDAQDDKSRIQNYLGNLGKMSWNGVGGSAWYFT